MEASNNALKARLHQPLLVKRNTYSVPPRLAEEWVRVRLYEMTLEVWYADRRMLALPRILGERKGEVAYLRNLNLAAEEMERAVEAAMGTWR